MPNSNEVRSIIRKAMRLSVPVMLEEALGTAVQYVDAAMVGRLGASASAAVGMTSSVSWMVNSPIWAMGVAVMAVISRAEGAGDYRRSKEAAVQSVWLAVGVGALLTAVTQLIARPLPGWMGAEEFGAELERFNADMTDVLGQVGLLK